MDRLKFCLALVTSLVIGGTAFAQPSNDLGTMVSQDVYTGGFLEGTYFDIRNQTGNSVGYQGGYTQIGTMIPFLNDGDWMIAANTRLLITDTSRIGANLGGILGYYDTDLDRIFRLYGYWDTDQSNITNARYNQVMMGFETMGQFLDFRMNAYAPTFHGNHFVSRTGIDATNPVFVGNTVGVRGIGLYEGALQGGDFEIGMPIIPGQGWIRGFIGGYTYGGADKDPTGIRLRSDMYVSNDMTVGVQATHDTVYGTNVNAVFSWQFAGLMPTRWFPNYSVREKMLMNPNRQWRIATGLHTSSETIAALNPADGKPYVVTFVGNSTGEAGNGSYEHAYRTLPGTAPGSQLIVVRRGDSAVNPIGGTLALTNGQQVLGEGQPFSLPYTVVYGNFVKSGVFNSAGVPGPAPILSNPAGPVFTLADNNVVAGVEVRNSGGPAITNNPLVGSNNFNIHDVTLRGNNGGILMSGLTGTGLLNNVNVQNTIGNGIELSSGPGTLNTSFTNVTSSGGTGTGITFAALNGPANATFNNVTTLANVNGIILNNTNGLGLTAAMNNINSSLNSGVGMQINGVGGQTIINAQNVAITTNGQSNFVSNMFNSNAQVTFSGTNSFSNSNGGAGISILQDGGTSNYSFMGTVADSNKGTGLDLLARNAGVLSVNYDNGSLNNNGTGISTVAQTGSLINLSVDPTTIQKSANVGYFFDVSGGSVLNAQLISANLSDSGTYGVLGRVDGLGSGAFLNMTSSHADRAGADGLFVTATNNAFANLQLVGTTFVGSGQNAGLPNRNGIHAVLDNSSQMELNLQTVDANSVGGNGLLFAASQNSFLDLNVTNTSFNSSGANAVRGSLSTGSAAQIAMNNVAANAAGQNGFYVDVNSGSALLPSYVNNSSFAFANGNAFQLDVNNSQAQLTVDNTSGFSAGADGLQINANNNAVVNVAYQNVGGNTGTLANAGQNGLGNSAAARVNANNSQVQLNLTGVNGDNEGTNTTVAYGVLANLTNSTLTANISNGAFDRARVNAFTFNMNGSTLNADMFNATGSKSGQDGLHIESVASNFTVLLNQGDFSDSGSANSVLGVASNIGNAVDITMSNSIGNVNLNRVSGARAGGDGLSIVATTGSNLTFQSQNNGLGGSVGSFENANQANGPFAGAVKILSDNSTLNIALPGINGGNTLPNVTSNYGIAASILNNSNFTLNLANANYDNNIQDAFNFNIANSVASIGALNVTGKNAGRDGFHLDGINSIVNVGWTYGDFSNSGGPGSVLGVANANGNAFELNLLNSAGTFNITNVSGSRAGADGLVINATANSLVNFTASNDGTNNGTQTSFDNANQAGNPNDGAIYINGDSSTINFNLVGTATAGINGNNTFPNKTSQYGMNVDLNNSVFTANLTNGNFNANLQDAFNITATNSNITMNATNVTGAFSGRDGLRVSTTNSNFTNINWLYGDFSDSGSAGSVLGVANANGNAVELIYNNVAASNVTLTNVSGLRAGGDGLLIDVTNTALNVIAQNDGTANGTPTSFADANQAGTATAGGVRVSADSSILGLSPVGVNSGNTLPNRTSNYGITANIVNNSAFTANLSNGSYSNSRIRAFDFNSTNSTVNVNALNTPGARSGDDGLHIAATNSTFNAIFQNGDLSDSGSAANVTGVGNANANAADISYNNSIGSVILTNTSGSRAGGDGLLISAVNSILSVTAQNDGTNNGTQTSFDNANQAFSPDKGAVRFTADGSTLNLALVGTAARPVNGGNTLPYNQSYYGVVGSVINNSAFNGSFTNGAYDNNRNDAFNFNVANSTFTLNAVNVTGRNSGRDGLHVDAINSPLVAGNAGTNINWLYGDFSNSGSANSVLGVANSAGNAAEINFSNSTGSVSLTNVSGTNAGGTGLLINAATNSLLTVNVGNDGTANGTTSSFANANQAGTATDGGIRVTSNTSTVNLNLNGVNSGNTLPNTTSNYGIVADISNGAFTTNLTNAAFDNSRISAMSFNANNATVNITGTNVTGARSGDDGLHIAATNSVFNFQLNQGDFSDSGSAANVTGVGNGNANAIDIAFTNSTGTVSVNDASGARAGGDGLLVNLLGSTLNLSLLNDGLGGTTTTFADANQTNSAGRGAVNLTVNNSNLNLNMVGVSGNNNLPYSNSNYGIVASVTNQSTFTGHVSAGLSPSVRFDNNRNSAFFFNIADSTFNFSADNATGSRSGIDGLHVDAIRSVANISIVNGDFSDSGAPNSVTGVAVANGNAVELNYSQSTGNVFLTNTSGSRAGGDGLLINASNNSLLTVIGQNIPQPNTTVTSFDNANQAFGATAGGVNVAASASTVNLQLLGVAGAQVDGGNTLPNNTSNYGLQANIVNNSAFNAVLTNGSYNRNRIDAFNFNVDSSVVSFNATNVTGSQSGEDGLFVNANNATFNASFVYGDFSDSGTANSVTGVANANGNAVDVSFNRSTGAINLTRVSGDGAGGDGLTLSSNNQSSLTFTSLDDGTGLGTNPGFNNAAQTIGGNFAAIRNVVDNQSIMNVQVAGGGNPGAASFSQDYGYLATVTNSSQLTTSIFNSVTPVIHFDNNRVSAFAFNVADSVVNFSATNATGARSGVDGLHIDAIRSTVNVSLVNSDLSDSGGPNNITGITSANGNAVEANYLQSAGNIFLTNTSGSRAGGDGLLINAIGGSNVNFIGQNTNVANTTATSFDNANQSFSATGGAINLTANNSTLNVSLLGIAGKQADGGNTAPNTSSNYGLQANIVNNSLFTGTFTNGNFNRNRIDAFKFNSDTSTVNFSATNVTGNQSGQDGLHIDAKNSNFVTNFTYGDFSNSGTLNSVTGIANGNGNAVEINFNNSLGSVNLIRVSGNGAGGDGLLITDTNASNLTVSSLDDGTLFGTAPGFNNAGQAIGGSYAGVRSTVDANSVLNLNIAGGAGAGPNSNSLDYGYILTATNGSTVNSTLNGGNYGRARLDSFNFNIANSNVNFSAVGATGAQSGRDGLHVDAVNSANTTISFIGGDFSDSGSANSVTGIANALGNAAEINFVNAKGAVTLTNTSGSRAGGDGLLINANTNSLLTFVGNFDPAVNANHTSFDNAGQSNAGAFAGVRTTTNFNSGLNIALLGSDGGNSGGNKTARYGMISTVQNGSLMNASLSNGSYSNVQIDAFNFNVANSTFNLVANNVTGSKAGQDGLHIDATNSTANFSLLNGDFSDSGSAGSVNGIANVNGNAMELNYNNSVGLVSVTNASGSRAGGDGLLINALNNSGLTVYAQNDNSGQGTVTSFDNAGQFNTANDAAVRFTANNSNLTLALIGASGNNTLPFANQEYGVTGTVTNSTFNGSISNGNQALANFDNNRISAMSFNVTNSNFSLDATNTSGQASGDDGLHLDSVNSTVTMNFTHGNFNNSGNANSVTGILNPNANAVEMNFTNSLAKISMINAAGSAAGGDGLLVTATANSNASIAFSNDGSGLGSNSFADAGQSNAGNYAGVRTTVDASVLGVTLLGTTNGNTGANNTERYGVIANVTNNSGYSLNLSNASYDRARIDAFNFNISGSTATINANNVTGKQAGQDGLHIDALNSVVNVNFAGGDFSDSGSTGSVTGIANANGNAAEINFTNTIGSVSLGNTPGNNAGGDGLLVNVTNGSRLVLNATDDQVVGGPATTFFNAGQFNTANDAAVRLNVDSSTLYIAMLGASGDNRAGYTNLEYGVIGNFTNSTVGGIINNGNAASVAFDSNRINAFNFNATNSNVNLNVQGATGTKSGDDGLHVVALNSTFNSQFTYGDFSDSGNTNSVTGILNANANAVDVNFSNSTGSVNLTRVGGARSGGDGLLISDTANSNLSVLVRDDGSGRGTANDFSDSGLSNAGNFAAVRATVNASTLNLELQNTSGQNTLPNTSQRYGVIADITNNSNFNATLSNGSYNNNRISAFNFNVDTSIANLTATGVTGAKSGDDGLHITANNATANFSFTNGDFSDSGSNASVTGVANTNANAADISYVGSVGTVSLLNTPGTRAGGTGLLINGSTLSQLNVNVTNGSFNDSSQAGGLFDAGVSATSTGGSVVKVGLNNTTLNNTVALNPQDYGLLLTANTASTLTVSASNSLNLSGNRLNGINASVSDLNSLINMVPLNGVTANNNGSTGMVVNVQNGATFNGQFVGGSFSNNGSIIPGDGVFIQVDGVNGATPSTASVAFDGTAASGNTIDGFSFQSSNGAVLNALLQTSGANGTLTASNNTFNGVNFDVQAGSTGRLLMNGNNVVSNNGTTNGSSGLFVSSTNSNEVLLRLSGSYNNNGQGGVGGDGITVNLNNVAKSAVEIFGNSANTASNNAGVGISVTLTGQTLDNQTFAPIIVNDSNNNPVTLIPGTSLHGLDIEGYTANNNSLGGIAINGTNSVITANTGSILNNVVNGTTSGDGVLLNLNGTTANNFVVSGNQIANNSGNGVNFNLVNSSMQNLQVTNNKNAANTQGINNNGLNGILFTLTNTPLSNFTIDSNFIGTNGSNVGAGGNGINFVTVSASDISGTISNNTITGNLTNNGQGDGIRILNPISVTSPIILNLTGNTITQNRIGFNASINQNNSISGVLVGNFNGNTISNNRSFGVRVDGSDKADINLNFTTNNGTINTLNANVDAGIGVTLAGNATGEININGTTVSGTTNGADATFNGEGVGIRLSGNASLANVNNLTIGDAALTNTNITGNAGGGVVLNLQGTSAIPTLLLQNATISNNTGRGVDITALNNANITTTNFNTSTINSNTTGGVAMTLNNSATMSTITFQDMTVRSNGQDGVLLDTIGNSTVNTISFLSNGNGDSYALNERHQIDIQRNDSSTLSNTILNGVTVTGTNTSQNGLNYIISNGIAPAPQFNLLVDNSTFSNNQNGILANAIATVEIDGHINTSTFTGNRNFGINFLADNATSFGGPLNGNAPYVLDGNTFTNNGTVATQTGGGVLLTSQVNANMNVQISGNAQRQTYTNNGNGIRINNTGTFGATVSVTQADFDLNGNGINITNTSGTSNFSIGQAGVANDITMTRWQNDGVIANLAAGTTALTMNNVTINNAQGTATTGVDAINITSTTSNTVAMDKIVASGSGTNGIVITEQGGSSTWSLTNSDASRNATGRGMLISSNDAANGNSSSYNIGTSNTAGNQTGNTFNSNGMQGLLYIQYTRAADQQFGSTAANSANAFTRYSAELNQADIQAGGGAQTFVDYLSHDFRTNRVNVIGNQISANGQTNNNNNIDGAAFFVGSNTRLDMNYSGNTMLGNVGNSFYISSFASANPINSVENGPNAPAAQPPAHGTDHFVADPTAHLNLVFGAQTALAGTSVPTVADPNYFNVGDHNIDGTSNPNPAFASLLQTTYAVRNTAILTPLVNNRIGGITAFNQFDNADVYKGAGSNTRTVQMYATALVQGSTDYSLGAGLPANGAPAPGTAAYNAMIAFTPLDGNYFEQIGNYQTMSTNGALYTGALDSIFNTNVLTGNHNFATMNAATILSTGAVYGAPANTPNNTLVIQPAASQFPTVGFPP